MYNQDDIDMIRESVDCRAIAIDLLDLPYRKIGTRYEILCPFHNDRHFGSTVVYETHMCCYACGKSADAIELVRQVLNVSFRDAVQKIAEFAGIKLSDQEQDDQRDVLYISRDDVSLIEMSPKTVKSLFKVNPVCCLDKMIIQAKKWVKKYREIPGTDLYPEASKIVEKRILKLDTLIETLKDAKKTVTDKTEIRIIKM